MEALFFYLLGGTALVAAVAVVALRRVFYAAGALIVCLCAVAGLYLLLEAPFIAAVQVIVYAGAVMVLFLFVIMLLDPFSADVFPDKSRRLRFFAPLLMALALLALYAMLRTHRPGGAPGGGAASSSLERLAETLFSEYLLPFEVTSVLILVAIIGAVVLAKRRT